MNPDEVKNKIRSKVLELAVVPGNARPMLGDDEVIPQLGILDSASMMALVLWYEDEFGVSTEDEDLTVDNFGTVKRMADYLSRRF
jgi:acyl carrier protein